MRKGGEKHKTFSEQLNVSISLFPARSYEMAPLVPLPSAEVGEQPASVPLSDGRESANCSEMAAWSASSCQWSNPCYTLLSVCESDHRFRQINIISVIQLIQL